MKSLNYSTNIIQEVIKSLNETDIVKKNFDKWRIFGIYIWPNSFIGNNYYEEIDFLKNWIKNRTSWLDESINNL